MAGDQLPVLTLDIDESKIAALNEISEKFKAAFSVGPGGFPVPQSVPAPTPDLPSVPSAVPGQDKSTSKKGGDSEFDKFLKTLNKDAKATLKTFGLINKTLGVTTSTLKGLFTTTVSWGARLAAIGGGGLFGYGYMAHRATEQYKSSQGLGVSTGEMQAANNVYGSRFSNTGNILQALAAAQNDPTNPQYAGLMSLGINPHDGAAANLPKLLEGVSILLKQYKGTGVSQAVLKGYGLDGVIDVATANQVLANSDRLPQLNKQFADQSQRLDRDLGSGTQQSYQDLSARFMDNASRIGNTFLKTLARLNGPIGRISYNLTASIEKFLNGRNGQALFDTLANGLQKLGNWLGSDDFQRDLDSFSKAVKRIAQAIGAAIDWLAGYGIKAPTSVDEARNQSSFDVTRTKEELAKSGQTPQQAAEENGGALGFLKAVGNTTLGLLTGGNVTVDSIEQRWRSGGWSGYQEDLIKSVTNTNENAGLPGGLLPAVAGTESSWNPKALNSSSGAAGLFQFTADTGNRYGLSAQERYDPEKSAAAAAQYFQDNLKRYGGDIAKSLAQYNGGNAAVTADGNLSLKKETVDYLLKILPQVQGGLQQHPGIRQQLETASSTLAQGGKNDRATINLQIAQVPGSDISAQVKGIYVTPR
ncbi:transglycosylase SLT domain-containing protein [Enterobacter asburiae]|uniref:Transglycosylase SLT domain-containing protein n=1 Tax=Enterobacter asburiae TaxID=61645 RepID=A0ABU6KTS5_ENTAS|nr:transglycosylase SLT domain-containing protein [Enterobacter asburiae]MCK1017148.1 transglycosylase SLT domain-containing protein [Enterobacter asburiae]MDU2341990.1 transglycosylase SLT domain-containing protein [Enterobacter asburiae]MDU7759494.1 transglycosylase SLT domain-containing protein [Enterobacter asburiae]MEC5729316.1 transglycosylase SLT domain-containing protein [Enterobacter asburiae]MEC5861266.1 transglycosylase SLT domain-containing protein [Enterobacter asburiae]